MYKKAPGSPRLPLYARLDHITCHQLEPLVEVLAELWVRPVQVTDEGLQRLQLPEEILGSRTAVAEIRNLRLAPSNFFVRTHGRLHEVCSSSVAKFKE